jgi:hypothetical protein
MCKDKWNVLDSNYKKDLQIIIKESTLVFGICRVKKKGASNYFINSTKNITNRLSPFKEKILLGT